MEHMLDKDVERVLFSEEELHRRVAEIAAEIGNDGAGALKRYVTESVNGFLAPIRERRRELEGQPEMVREILHEGNRRANEIANATLDEVREAMGMVY